MADLPEERVEVNVYPFTNSRVDNFGQFEVTILRRPVKHWCCLFTFLVTRAVHIEVIIGLDIDACMMANTRFIARRRIPHTVISDNGTNFVRALRESRECFNQSDYDATCEGKARCQIVWKFSCLGGPHFGGNWERLVRSCKKAMYALLGSRRQTLPVLMKTMCLVEQIIYSRPSAPVSDDPEHLQALTPNHFLQGRPVVAEPLMPDAASYVNCRKM